MAGTAEGHVVVEVAAVGTAALVVLEVPLRGHYIERPLVGDPVTTRG